MTAITLPGFTAELALGAKNGSYRTLHSSAPSGTVTPQLPIGPIGNGLGTCCCVDYIGGWVNAVAQDDRRIKQASWTPDVTMAGLPIIWGGFRIQCTNCPEGYEGSTSDCTCDCQADGTPCATRDNVQVCES
jgi:hypothetical protein